MNFNHLLLLLIFTPLWLVRGARWLAIVQQKEYRLDRLWLFLKTKEGKKDLWHLLPQLTDFSRRGLKRPVRTARAGLLAVMTIALMLTLYWLVGWQYLWLISLLLYLILPALVIAALFPTAFIKVLVTWYELNTARKIIQQHQPLVIGVTGSYGKTTTKQLLAHVLQQKYSVFFTPKSFNTMYSVAKSLRQGFTNQRIVILEYAAYTPGEIKQLASWLPPNLAIITGLTEQHLGLFGSQQRIIEAKAELVKAIENKGPIFCNARDKGTLDICRAGGRNDWQAFSGPESKIKLTNIKLDSQGKLQFTWLGALVETQLVGKHYLETVQAAIAVARQLDLSGRQIVAGLKSFKPSNSFIKIRKSRGLTIIDDGHTTNPQGFTAALELLDHFKKQNTPTLLITSGIIDLGKQSASIHSKLAKQAKKVANQVWYLGIDGSDQFKQVYTDQMKDDINVIEQQLSLLLNGTVILIEGRIPSWLVNKLK